MAKFVEVSPRVFADIWPDDVRESLTITGAFELILVKDVGVLPDYLFGTVVHSNSSRDAAAKIVGIMHELMTTIRSGSEWNRPEVYMQQM